jgi:hypothetical protein
MIISKGISSLTWINGKRCAGLVNVRRSPSVPGPRDQTELGSEAKIRASADALIE